MLMGRYEYSLDAKSRTNFPPKFKAKMGDTLYVTKWFDSCLVVFGEKEWEEMDSKFANLPITKSRELTRMFYGNAAEINPDKQGRILIPQYLKDHAKLEKDIVIIGSRKYAEIWNKEEYEANEKLNDFASIEEKLAELEF